jgi:hypothetical protein
MRICALGPTSTRPFGPWPVGCFSALLTRPVSIQIWALRSRLEKQPTDLRRCHHYMRDGTLETDAAVTESRVHHLAGSLPDSFGIVAFLFLIDYAAKMLRPVSLVQRWRRMGSRWWRVFTLSNPRKRTASQDHNRIPGQWNGKSSISRSMHCLFFLNASENAVHRKLAIVKIPGRSFGRSVSKSAGVVVLGALQRQRH